MNPEGAQPSAVTAQLTREIDEALDDAFGESLGNWQIVHQAISGSRINYLMQVDTAETQAQRVWCRATEQATDEAFGERYRLATEADVLVRLADLGIAVPGIIGRSASGRVIIQNFIDLGDGPAPNESTSLADYMAALDEVHALDPVAILGLTEGLTADSPASTAVAMEHAVWLTVAQSLLADRDGLDRLGESSGIERLADRIDDVRQYLDDIPSPRWDEPLTLVHGDAGRANFLQDKAGSLWIIDWELAHAGSRLEDYAWCEVRGLEENSALWRAEIARRLEAFGSDASALYNYFRVLIFFRSVIAITARIKAEPDGGFVPYLVVRFCENEALGWLSADEFARVTMAQLPLRSVADMSVGYGIDDGSNERLSEWHKWTDAVRSSAGGHGHG